MHVNRLTARCGVWRNATQRTRPRFAVSGIPPFDVAGVKLQSGDWLYHRWISGAIIHILTDFIRGSDKEAVMPKDKAVYSIELEKDMMAFVEQMTTKYDLPDVSKTMRCLVNYARDVEASQDTIFSDVRCLNCD